MKKIDKNKQIKLIKLILIIIWMTAIFIFSGQQGTESGDTSRKFTIMIIRIITGKSLEINDPFVEGIQLFIRKFAHFTIYAMGGFLIMNYIASFNITQKRKILYSISSGGVYAITDEIHQFFVPGRSGNIIDVGIDTLGVITGVIIYILISKLIKCVLHKK